MRLETPGGGGFGDPATRDPERVARDVRLGYVSREAAQRDYKVVLRDDGTLDADATAQARAGAHERRGVIVGVDVGGTFTDLFLLRRGDAHASAPRRCRRAAATRRKAS